MIHLPTKQRPRIWFSEFLWKELQQQSRWKPKEGQRWLSDDGTFSCDHLYDLLAALHHTQAYMPSPPSNAMCILSELMMMILRSGEDVLINIIPMDTNYGNPSSLCDRLNRNELDALIVVRDLRHDYLAKTSLQAYLDYAAKYPTADEKDHY